MIDEIFDRQYQSGRNGLHDGVDWLVSRVSAAFGTTFKAVHRAQFDAPWAKGKRAGHA